MGQVIAFGSIAAARRRVTDHHAVAYLFDELNDGARSLSMIVDEMVSRYCVDLDVLDDVVRARCEPSHADDHDYAVAAE